MNDTDWKAATDEATAYLADLIRFDTTNPPGNELECAEYLADLLAREGIEPEVLESEPGRANVISRLRGDGSKKPLLLMSHLDVCAPLLGRDKGRLPLGKGNARHQGPHRNAHDGDVSPQEAGGSA